MQFWARDKKVYKISGNFSGKKYFIKIRLVYKDRFMINIAKTAMALGKTVYTTRTAGARTTTMFDAFCKTMSRPDVAAQRASRIVADTEKRSAESQIRYYQILV